MSLHQLVDVDLVCLETPSLESHLTETEAHSILYRLRGMYQMSTTGAIMKRMVVFPARHPPRRRR